MMLTGLGIAGGAPAGGLVGAKMGDMPLGMSVAGGVATGRRAGDSLLEEPRGVGVRSMRLPATFGCAAA